MSEQACRWYVFFYVTCLLLMLLLLLLWPPLLYGYGYAGMHQSEPRCSQPAHWLPGWFSCPLIFHWHCTQEAARAYRQAGQSGMAPFWRARGEWGVGKCNA